MANKLFNEWLVDEFLLSEGAGTRYSIEINYRTDFNEVRNHFVKLCLGYVMAALKKYDYHVKHVFTVEPNRILISTRSWDDGEWNGVLSYNTKTSKFIFSEGVYSKLRGTCSIMNSIELNGNSASSLVSEILGKMETLRKKPLHDGIQLNPAKLKRGPKR